jgi:hypothetical protein
MATGSRRAWPHAMRRNGGSLALLLSVLIHVLVLGWFGLKRAAGEFGRDAPTVNIELVRLPQLSSPENAPSAADEPAAGRVANEPVESDVPPRPASPAGTSPRGTSGTGTGVDPRWAVDLNGPVFADGRWPRQQLLTRCDPLKDPKRESAACRREDAVARGVTRANDPRNGTDEFAREARHNEAVKRYHELPGGAGYTGIGCHVFHRC